MEVGKERDKGGIEARKERYGKRGMGEWFERRGTIKEEWKA